ncbi:GatB/YqeY domain-containing protein [Zafaria sp. Z1313]|uniref:GatB/YqeY domain-containing protein n=1 Tax=unclassified Zafaria TaxID=2828765 RepID=UPI002E785EE2|nr:GatB/YqeY domain-containing protein [Zafaria sp. J156]MEE1622555.1 GatB/YqeY domain-containing protein [Zafaria sp. J156]
MTTLKDRLRADMTTHLKSGNKVALTTVRNLLGEINTREKGGKTPVELDDVQVVALLQKEAARRRETAQTYTDAGHSERASAETAEAEVIEGYLPAPLTEDDVVLIVDRAIEEASAGGERPGMRQMGQVMKTVSAEVAGRFDGKRVSELVRARLA